MAEFRQCPQCRGYGLERQWCDLCKGAGMVRNEDHSAPTVFHVRTLAEVIERARSTGEKDNG
ncbi:UNVERIFIED_CONTAM: hypothetical protein OHV15_19265 [Microbacterium sp. SLM126]